MSGLSIVLNDSTPALSPTNGCCAGIANFASVAYIDMSVNGSAGSAGSNVNIGSGSPETTFYYVGNSGDYNGQTISAGTWQVPIHTGLVSETATIYIESVYICRANSSGVSQQTIGSATSLGYQVVGNTTYTFNITGESVTFSTGDIVVISFQMQCSGSGNVPLHHDQTIVAPSSSPPPNNPIQTVLGCSSNYYVDFPFSTPPTVGNSLAVPIMANLPNVYYSTPLTCKDNYGNSYQGIIEKAINSSNGGVDVMMVFFAPVKSSGSGFEITVESDVLTPGGAYNVAGVAYELQGMLTSQPDVTSYQTQLNGGSSFPSTAFSWSTTHPQDFGIAILQVDTAGASESLSRSGWTRSMTLDWTPCAGVALSGEFDYVQLSSENSGTATNFWTSISPSAYQEHGALVFLAGGTAIVADLSLNDFDPCVLPASYQYSIKFSPTILDAGLDVLAAGYQAPSYYTQPLDGVIDILPASFAITGTNTFVASLLDFDPVVLPATYSENNNNILQILRGPYTALPGLKEGEPMLCGIVVNGSVVATVEMFGDHNGNNVILGGGVQTCAGSPAWTPSVSGAVVLWDTTNNVFQVGYNGTWHQVS